MKISYPIAITRSFEAVLRERIQQPLNFMQVVLGPRQVGKTTGVTHIFNDWPHSKIMASADLPAPPDSTWILQQWNAAISLPGPVLLVFDEIQKIPRWSESIKLLFDRHRTERRVRLVLLGSASLALGLGLNETLTGRFELIPVAHWSYPECHAAFNWDLSTYERFGGYPAAAELADQPTRWQEFMRDSILEPTLSKDIFGLVTIRKPALFRQVFEIAVHFPAQILSYQKMLGQLHEPGNISTIQNYLEILEAAFLIKRLPAFSRNIVRLKSSSPKLLPLCPALIHAFIDPVRFEKDLTWRGRLREAVVGAALVQKYAKVSYWSKNNLEVDYVVEHDDKIFAIEVKSGYVRKRSGLSAFIKENPEAIPMIIDHESIDPFLRDPRLTARP